jgi:hypothetical protein
VNRQDGAIELPIRSRRVEVLQQLDGRQIELHAVFDKRWVNMNLQSFKRSIVEPQPPEGLSLALQALWWDAKADWEKAHARAQEHDDQAGMRVHAYLHRKEGDQSNAAYWYRRCDVSPATGTLEEEWEELVQELLAKK